MLLDKLTSPVKFYIYLGLGILLLAAIGSAIWYYNWSQSEIKTLRENNAKLLMAVQENEKTIKSLRDSASRMQSVLTETNKKFQKTREENNRLKEILSRHDIGYLASRKPKLVEKIINKGTDDAGRCFEILSGSPLSQSELNATKPSQINKICSNIANPNYKKKQ